MAKAKYSAKEVKQMKAAQPAPRKYGTDAKFAKSLAAAKPKTGAVKMMGGKGAAGAKMKSKYAAATPFAKPKTGAVKKAAGSKGGGGGGGGDLAQRGER